MARVSFGSRAGGDLGLNYPRAAVTGPRDRPACQTLEELTAALREDIAAAQESPVPECTTSEVRLTFSALVPLKRPNIGPYSEGGEHDLPPEFKTSYFTRDDGKKQYPTTTVHAVVSIPVEQDARQTVQRAASRGIMSAVEKADGFKYTFNNAWAAKDDDGMRFSYICQDSTQNRDRHANGFTRTQKHLKGERERGPRKPTFDCKGAVSVKCSQHRGCIDVYYRHYAIHPSVEQRRPPPRKPPRHLREGYVPPNEDQNSGDLAVALQGEDDVYTAPAFAIPQASNISRPRKRKRESNVPKQSKDPSDGLSLADLLRQSQTAQYKAKPRSTEPTPANAGLRPPPVNYEIPSSQAPPPPPAPKPPQQRPPKPQNHNLNPLPSSYQPPYQPPYQPVAPSQPSYPQPSTYPPAHQQPPPRPKQWHGELPQDQLRGQSLFTTMKLQPSDPFTAPIVAPHQQMRTKISCINCTSAKRRCDEGKPTCGSCMREGRSMCQYPGGYDRNFEYLQPPDSVFGQHAPFAPMQQGLQREESPDPWFPKR